MKEEELIKQIKDGLTLIKANPSKLRNFLSVIFRLSDRLSNKELVRDFKGKLMEIQSLTDERSIVVKVEEIIGFIESLKNKNENPFANTFLGKIYGINQYEYSPSYLKDLEKYKAVLKEIKEMEERILNDPVYVSHHHEKINDGTYKRYLHARIKRNLRIMYKIEGDTLRFYRIITKNEFESSQ